jgi:hypothetical protein
MTHPQDFESLWRASAHEAVPHTDLFPEALLVLPELTDNSISANATKIEINIHITGSKGIFICKDNGHGVKSTSVNRLLSWASPKSTNLQNRYGHGKNKFLSKWCLEYKEAVWSFSWRTCDARGVQSCLNTIKTPFIGRDTEIHMDEKDEVTLTPSGAQWTVEFDTSIVKPELFESIKEILCTRYSTEHFQRIEFILTVGSKKESSKQWKTFQQSLDYEVETKNAYLLYNIQEEIEGGRMVYKLYTIIADGRKQYPFKADFPVMGQKNMICSRIHISLDGRMIEPIPIYRLLGRESNHNDFNGQYGIVHFIPNQENSYDYFPTPCTTKVSFYENCPNFKKFTEKMKAIHRTKPNSKPVYTPQSKTLVHLLTRPETLRPTQPQITQTVRPQLSPPQPPQPDAHRDAVIHGTATDIQKKMIQLENDAILAEAIKDVKEIEKEVVKINELHYITKLEILAMKLKDMDWEDKKRNASTVEDVQYASMIEALNTFMRMN